MKTWTIYCHIHVESGRKYVGLTKQTMESRWKKHIYTAKSSKGGRWHFPNAIRKYGPEAFSHTILETCSSLEEANLAEQKWIEKFDSRNPEKGFNLAPGGTSSPHSIRKNPWNNPEFRVKILAKMKALGASPAFKAKISAAVLKQVNTPGYHEKRCAISQEIWSRPEVYEKSRLNRKPRSREFMIKISRMANPNANITDERRAKCRIAGLKAWTSEARSKRNMIVTDETRTKHRINAKLRTPELLDFIRNRMKDPQVRLKISKAAKTNLLAQKRATDRLRSPEVTAKAIERIRSPEIRAKIGASVKYSNLLKYVML